MKRKKVYYLSIPFLSKDEAKKSGKIISEKTPLHGFISEVDFFEYLKGEHEWA